MNSFTLILDTASNRTLLEPIWTTALGSFLGAFFAFIFFILSKKYEKRKEWQQTYKKEHSYLERYFYDLKVDLIDNKKRLRDISARYKAKEIGSLNLIDLPIRDGISMRVDDIIFINRVETYAGKCIKRLNYLQNEINRGIDDLNKDLVSTNEKIQKNAEKNCQLFIQEIDKLIARYDFHIDATEKLIIENSLLLKKYKKWEYRREGFNSNFIERKNEIEIEACSNDKLINENPLNKEYITGLKKFGLVDDI